MSGLVWAKLTKDQTSEKAFKAAVEWSHRAGTPHCVRTDGGGSFCSRFSLKLREIRIEHVLTSPYNSPSNGGCERAIRSVKHVLQRDGIRKMTQEILDNITFGIICQPLATG